LPEWEVHSLYGTDTSSRIYKETAAANRYHVGRKLNNEQRLALEAIVDCEPFWEIPTNLFSFFYGLPDEREALRKLLE